MGIPSLIHVIGACTQASLSLKTYGGDIPIPPFVQEGLKTIGRHADRKA